MRTGAVKSLASPTSMPAHDEDASDSFESDSSASESDESNAASGARLLPATRNVGPKSPGEGRTRSGVSSVWTPAAVAASTRWPYTLHIAMELCPGSTLRDWIRQRPRGDVRMGAVAHIFRRLVEALRYCATFAQCSATVDLSPLGKCGLHAAAAAERSHCHTMGKVINLCLRHLFFVLSCLLFRLVGWCLRRELELRVQDAPLALSLICDCLPCTTHTLAV